MGVTTLASYFRLGSFKISRLKVRDKVTSSQDIWTEYLNFSSAIYPLS